MNELILSTGRKVMWGVDPRKSHALNIHYGGQASAEEMREAATKINQILHPETEKPNA